MIRLFDLTGRIALVTGASRGIGRAIALGLAEAGADVALVARGASPLEEAAAAVRAFGRRALALAGDAGNEQDIRRVVAETVAGLGGIHILVNNAALPGGARPAERVQLGVWDETMAVNLRGAFLMCQAAAEVMIPQRYGKIINTTSALAEGGMSRSIPYGPAKGGLRSLTHGLAADWACYGICVNSLAPGFVETEMNVRSRGNQQFYAQVLGRVPMRRWGQPEDLAGAAVFLAAPASDWVTGTTLVVDGGMTYAWDPLL